jgi:serine/threonine-protein kinase
MPAMTAADTIKQIDVTAKRCNECGARFGVDAAFCPFDGSKLVTATWPRMEAPSAPTTADGRYELAGHLGEGGMGTVYKVRHRTLNRFFALKVLRSDLATDAGLAERFVQEARATAAIRHPAIVAITDFGEMEDKTPYFVMELLEGETLGARIRRTGPIEPRMAIRIARQIAEGLAASHAANVIHRDLKPDNVFLVGEQAGKEPEAEIRIVDFGAAKVIGASKVTRPGIVFGTPHYMSPEQANGALDIDRRADVYSLGVLLYEMLTGHVPFDADTYMGVLTKHLFEEPPRPLAPAGITLGPLEGIVMRALEKKREDRFASMEAFSQALGGARRGGGAVARRSRSAARSSPSGSSRDQSPRPPPPHVRSRPRRHVRMGTPPVSSPLRLRVHRSSRTCRRARPRRCRR